MTFLNAVETFADGLAESSPSSSLASASLASRRRSGTSPSGILTNEAGQNTPKRSGGASRADERPPWAKGRRSAGGRLDGIAWSTPLRPRRRNRRTTRRRMRSAALSIAASHGFHEPPMPRTPSSDLSMTDILPRLDALDHAVERLTTTLFRRPSGREGFPGWLEGVAGDPHPTTDQTAEGKECACASYPSTYAQLQAIQRRMGSARGAARGSTFCVWDSQRQSECLRDLRRGPLGTDGRRALAIRSECATSRRRIQPQQIHHARCIPNVTALRKDSLLVKCGRDLPKAESVLPQLCCAEGCGLFVTHGIRSRGVAFCLRRCRLLAAHRIADSCTLKDRVERARIHTACHDKGLSSVRISHIRRMGSSASYSSRMRNAALFLGSSTRTRRTMGVCFLRVSPSVGSRAKLHSQLLEVVHSFARSLADRFPFPLSDGHQHIQGPAFLLPSAYQSSHSPQAETTVSLRQSTVHRGPKSLTERVNLSSLTTTTASALPTSSIHSARRSPGRSIDFADTPSSEMIRSDRCHAQCSAPNLGALCVKTHAFAGLNFCANPDIPNCANLLPVLSKR